MIQNICQATVLYFTTICWQVIYYTCEYKNTTLQFPKFQEWYQNLFVITFQETYRCLRSWQPYLLVRKNVPDFSHKQSFLSRWSVCESNNYAMPLIRVSYCWIICVLVIVCDTVGQKDAWSSFSYATTSIIVYYLYYVHSTVFTNSIDNTNQCTLGYL